MCSADWRAECCDPLKIHDYPPIFGRSFPLLPHPRTGHLWKCLSWDRSLLILLIRRVIACIKVDLTGHFWQRWGPSQDHGHQQGVPQAPRGGGGDEEAEGVGHDQGRAGGVSEGEGTCSRPRAPHYESTYGRTDRFKLLWIHPEKITLLLFDAFQDAICSSAENILGRGTQCGPACEQPIPHGQADRRRTEADDGHASLRETTRVCPKQTALSRIAISRTRNSWHKLEIQADDNMHLLEWINWWVIN